MGLQNRREPSEIPEIDITPMLNVIVVVLAFFVVVSTTLSGEPDSVDVKVPDKSQPQQDPPNNNAEESETPPNLEVKVDESGGIVADEVPIDRAELLNQLPEFLQNHPDSQVYLIPDPNLPYEQVIQLLSEMRKQGGERVILAIRERQKTATTDE